ncbi:ABC transporter substrate-binding protein [Bifidobacterium mongoliense]|uniref:ABC transporter substrate-binding protein n=1 Tax=Bifidobacterium mongoliense TaxID=518643 RepID=UPI002A7603A6|nr:ABC transporter substrate-binding protein [Bifidobacterium mongoliense]MDY3125911.1 ABC transporter substrate-binding protein [Bifidobacterium mongoliense]
MLTVRFEYIHSWTNHAGFYMARANGDYARHHMDVVFSNGDSFRGTPAALLARGECEVALVRHKDLFSHQGGDTGLVAVAALNQCQVGGVVTSVDSGIHRFRDLEGRTLGFPAAAYRLFAELKEAMAKDGGDIAKVNVVSTGGWEPDFRSIESGIFDAFVNVVWWEPFQGSSPFDRIVTIPFDSLGIAPHYSYYVCVRREFLTRNEAVVRDFLRDTALGYRRAADDRDAAMRTLQDPLANVSPAVLAHTLDIIAPTWFDPQGHWGPMDIEAIRRYDHWMTGQGFMTVPESESLAAIDAGAITNAYLPW